jgi:Spy/CpxP family protein refolding chaperone
MNRIWFRSARWVLLSTIWLTPVGVGAEETHRKGILAELKLTHEQKRSLQGMREERRRTFELSKEVRDERKKIGELFRDRKVPEEEILRKVENVNRKMAEVNLRRARHMLALRTVLDEEQFRIVSDRMLERRQEAKKVLRERLMRRSEESTE